MPSQPLSSLSLAWLLLAEEGHILLLGSILTIPASTPNRNERLMMDLRSWRTPQFDQRSGFPWDY